MTFEEILDQAIAMLQRRGRVAYRTLKRQFQLDDEALEDLKVELIKAQRLATDEGGEVLVWTRAEAPAPARAAEIPSALRQELPTSASPRTASSSPIIYTPRHLAERIRAEQAALEARGTPDGERKTITALFADIKGSMHLLEDRDPEEARHIIDPALTLMMEAVHRYEGYVAQSLGDGIFALFGAPIAHEDHPQRALYAALRMQEALRQYAETLRREHGVNLEIRVGVNTGDVVLRSIRTDDLHTDYVPIGHATSLAARLQSLASGGAIVVSEPTYRLAEGYFIFAPLGVAQVKGVSEPIQMYEVAGVGPLRTKLQVAVHRGLVRFVGRQRELEQMQRALELAQGGHGQIVAVVGEPGVGKSRLCYEFKLRAQHGCLVLETFSVSHGKADPYLPLIELLKNYFRITPQDNERRGREKVTGRVLTLDRHLEDTVPYLFALLGIADPSAALAQMDPQIRLQRTFEAIKRLFVRESLNKPVLLLMEDLHWLDRETQAWLDLLSEEVATARLLLLVNYRPEYEHAWGSRTYYTQLRLDPLGQAEAEELVTALLRDDAGATGRSPLQSLKHLILAKTEGNPFFIEEIVQALCEQGVLVRDPTGGPGFTPASRITSLTEMQLPPTVQGVLAARIDRLPPEEKALLQTLAVIGKEFTLSLLTRVVEQPEDEVQRLLAHLRAAEFIYEQPTFPEPEYTFKHALTQEVAYNALLLERRRGLHERTGQAIEALFPSQLAEHYGALAHHYRRSGNGRKAVEYLQHAGQQAMQRSAYAEAISHVTTAVELLETLPDTVERAQRELALQITRGRALAVTQGAATPETIRAYARARELCQQMGEAPQLFWALSGLHEFYVLQGKDQQTAHELAEQLLSLAQRQRAPALLVTGHHRMGQSLFWLGALSAARSHLEQALALDDRQYHPSAVDSSGGESGVFSRNFAASALWLLGYPEQAMAHSQEALTRSRVLADPSILARALSWAALLHQYRREGPLAQQRAEACMTLATEHGLVARLALGTLLRGAALARQGQGEEGIAQIRQGLAGWRATGSEVGQTHYLAFLAEAYGQTGQAAEGLRTIAEALTFAHTTGERCWEADLYRLKGELLLQSGVQGVEAEVLTLDAGLQTRDAEVELCLHQALDIARRQQARSLELRAATSLSRLWQRQGKRQEAYDLLAPIYHWFTEGFDTADLQDAKALLDALA
jgi:class 3 adenylate cyclase/predicted ATPase